MTDTSPTPLKEIRVKTEHDFTLDWVPSTTVQKKPHLFASHGKLLPTPDDQYGRANALIMDVVAVWTSNQHPPLVYYDQTIHQKGLREAVADAEQEPDGTISVGLLDQVTFAQGKTMWRLLTADLAWQQAMIAWAQENMVKEDGMWRTAVGASAADEITEQLMPISTNSEGY